jgi:hypothetical protein
MQPGNKIIVDSFVCEDFNLPVLWIDSSVAEDFFLPVIRLSKRQMSDAVLAEWEQVCFRGHRV